MSHLNSVEFQSSRTAGANTPCKDLLSLSLRNSIPLSSLKKPSDYDVSRFDKEFKHPDVERELFQNQQKNNKQWAERKVSKTVVKVFNPATSSGHGYMNEISIVEAAERLALNEKAEKERIAYLRNRNEESRRKQAETIALKKAAFAEAVQIRTEKKRIEREIEKQKKAEELTRLKERSLLSAKSILEKQLLKRHKIAGERAEHDAFIAENDRQNQFKQASHSNLAMKRLKQAESNLILRDKRDSKQERKELNARNRIHLMDQVSKAAYLEEELFKQAVLNETREMQQFERSSLSSVSGN